jgi:hypothetical protein
MEQMKLLKMKSSFAKLIALSVLMSISSLMAQTSVSDYQLQRLGLFGIYADTLSDTANEGVALNKIDSILFAETESHFVDFPHIYYKYSFRELPCIKIFGIWSNKASGSQYNPYKEMIFNICDSTIYHYGGDIESFSKTIKKYLQMHFDSVSISKILTLFLNTNSRKSAYYILNSRNDFSKYYNEWYRDLDSSVQFHREKREKDIAIADKCVRNSVLVRKNGIYDAQLYTYNCGKGRIEFWHFVISKDEITLKNSKVLAEDIRPLSPID